MYTPTLILIIHYGYSIADTLDMGSDADSPRGRREEKTVSAIAFRQDDHRGGDSSFVDSRINPEGTYMMSDVEEGMKGSVRMTEAV
ncbi:hypothetical protein BDV98DRAFT_567033 [Pterulicium gracile]|uniref:Uncharacterized protein n=1 Tax=Pterulicium gracile TaxID=1884261 RepID=A0A5C3QJV0_9AGAR|nr:hypothetical protein BDV98DRAFT_567033 [Pterula gracilis]